MPNRKHPAKTVAVIGAGPVGLAAAAHLTARGITPIVLEAGDGPAAAIRQWGHVRLFSPWKFNIDAAAEDLLTANGWQTPNPEHLPTGNELVDQYLAPLAALPQLAQHIRYRTKVLAISRQGVDVTRTLDRDQRPYLLRTQHDDANTDVIANAVIDASGTWAETNPLGAHGLAAAGETEAAAHLMSPLPDILGADRDRFAGRHTLVVGMGHSAANNLLNLAELADQTSGTKISWAIRADTPARIYGGGDADVLPARGELGTRLKRLVADGTFTMLTSMVIDKFVAGPRTSPLTVQGRSGDTDVTLDVDVVVPATGFRPNLEMLREVRLDLDPGVEAPANLAPLIDPNFHSCGTVPPHGEKHLAHPDEGIYLAGMKSYGRAPTFLMATGYEQVRSIAAALAGDRAAADDVRLELPETGVCSAGPTVTDNEGAVTFAQTGDPDCAPAPPQGLPTGKSHGYLGEITASPPSGGCCGAPEPTQRG